MRNGAKVDVFKFTADRNATCQASDLNATVFQGLANDMGRRLSFSGEVGGQNHLLHLTRIGRQDIPGIVFRRHAIEKLLQTDVLGTDTVKRAELAHQNKIKPTVSRGTLHRILVGWGFDDTNLASVPLGTGASAADLQFGQGIAQRAMPDTV